MCATVPYFGIGQGVRLVDRYDAAYVLPSLHREKRKQNLPKKCIVWDEASLPLGPPHPPPAPPILARTVVWYGLTSLGMVRYFDVVDQKGR